jgi:hypothetical protein
MAEQIDISEQQLIDLLGESEAALKESVKSCAEMTEAYINGNWNEYRLARAKENAGGALPVAIGGLPGGESSAGDSGQSPNDADRQPGPEAAAPAG